MTSKKIAFVITDAGSFNTLMRGQLEFLQGRNINIHLFCGGDDENFDILRERAVGTVHRLPMRRKPHLARDIACLFWLIFLFARHRFDVVVSSTPKAMLLGTLAAFLSRRPADVLLLSRSCDSASSMSSR